MALNDQTSDLLTRIRNSLASRHRYVDVRLTKMNKAIVDVLRQTGFIDQMIANDEQNKLRVFLKYNKGRQPMITGLKRCSKPGARKYVNVQQIPRVLEGLGISILSTPRGIISGDEAKKENVGGELLCTIW